MTAMKWMNEKSKSEQKNHVWIETSREKKRMEIVYAIKFSYS